VHDLPAAAGGVTVRDVLVRAVSQLQASGSETPRLDAELLLGRALGVDRARLVLDARAPMDRTALARFDGLLARRRASEPVAYILGEREFRRLRLVVDRRVLIPRPETELLVELALGLPAGARVLDVGTGSGAVALALKDERPDLEVWGSDLSADALDVARSNGARLELPVFFVQADLLEGVPSPGEFDAVLANLPYVSTGDALPPDVGDYEPPDALFAGSDGLSVIRRLVDGLGATPFVALEVGEGQASAVASLLAGAGFASVRRKRDLAGIERVVVGER
jgi:release factor glutamine methyltransferase